MRAMIPRMAAAFLAACNAAGGGSGSVTGTVNGAQVVVHDVVGVVGTVTQNGATSSYAVVLLSDQGGTCSAAQSGGVTSAATRANALEIAATTSGAGPFAPGTYSVGSTGLAEYFYSGSTNSGGVAGTGSVTFNTVSASTLTGTFDVSLAGGQKLSGAFTAAVCSGVPTTPSPW